MPGWCPALPGSTSESGLNTLLTNSMQHIHTLRPCQVFCNVNTRVYCCKAHIVISFPGASMLLAFPMIFGFFHLFYFIDIETGVVDFLFFVLGGMNLATIRSGVFGGAHDVYDNNGNKVAVIKPGVFGGTQDIYDLNGNKMATTRAGVFGGTQDIYDVNGKKVSFSRPGAFGNTCDTYTTNGNKVTGRFRKYPGYLFMTSMATKREHTSQAIMDMIVRSECRFQRLMRLERRLSE